MDELESNEEFSSRMRKLINQYGVESKIDFENLYSLMNIARM